MNFNLLPWHRNAQPSWLDLASLALICAVVWWGYAQAAAAEDLHTARSGVVQPRCSGEFRAIATAMRPACMDVATARHLGAATAREGDLTFVHAGRPYAEKKNRASLPTARCSAHGVNDHFPSHGMLEVNAAGAVRGNGAGVSFVFAAGHPREVTNARAAGVCLRPRGFTQAKEADRV